MQHDIYISIYATICIMYITPLIVHIFVLSGMMCVSVGTLHLLAANIPIIPMRAFAPVVTIHYQCACSPLMRVFVSSKPVADNDLNLHSKRSRCEMHPYQGITLPNIKGTLGDSGTSSPPQRYHVCNRVCLLVYLLAT